MITKKTLQNNLLLISEDDKKFSTACIGFWVKTGSRFETEGQRGISHFTEHLIFKGTEHYSTQEISAAFDKMGGYINAFTERENVCVYCTIPVAWNKEQNLTKALDVMCEILEKAVFPEEEFLREKSVVQNEINAYADDMEESALDVLAEKMWPEQSLSKPITGSVEEVEKISREMILQWYEKYFVNGEVIAIASGNLNQQLIEEKLSALKIHKKVLQYPKEKHFLKEEKWTSGNFFVKSHFNQQLLFEAFEVKFPFSIKNHFESLVFNAFAGDSMSSRLFNQIREKSGLCYSVYSFFTFYENEAVWCACAGCDKKNILELKKQMDEELDFLLRREISDSEFENALEHVCGEEIIGSEDSEYLMKRLEHYNSMGFELLETDEIIKGIRSLKKNDIINFMKEILDFNRKCVLVYGPSKFKKWS